MAKTNYVPMYDRYTVMPDGSVVMHEIGKHVDSENIREAYESYGREKSRGYSDFTK